MLSFPVYMSNSSFQCDSYQISNYSDDYYISIFLTFHLTPFKWERRGIPKGHYSDLKISKVSAISCASLRHA